MARPQYCAQLVSKIERSNYNNAAGDTAIPSVIVVSSQEDT